MPAKVLAVAYGGGHANIVIPVLNALNERGVDTLFLALTSAGPQARRLGINHKSYIDYKHLVDTRRAEEIGIKLAESMHNPDLGIAFEESVYYLGINLLENIDTLGEDLAGEALRLTGRQAFLAVEFLKKIITEEKCSHIVTTNSPRSEKASLIAAQQLGLHSFRIDDLYGVPILYDSLIRKMGQEMYHLTTGRFKITPSQSCFLCDYARDNFIENQDKWDMIDVDYSNSAVTGQPAFDVIDEIVNENPTEIIFPDSPELPSVTWAHENGHKDEAEVVALLERCYQIRGRAYNFAIKVRPNIEPKDIDNILARFDKTKGNLRVIHTEMDPNVLIWNSDLVIGQVSTMLTQAAYMGRPVVILDPLDLRSSEPLAISRTAPVVRNDAELADAIESLSQKDSSMLVEFERGLQRMNFQKHGTRNVCDLIETYL